jgi:hypothetical protein
MSLLFYQQQLLELLEEQLGPLLLRVRAQQAPLVLPLKVALAELLEALAVEVSQQLLAQSPVVPPTGLLSGSSARTVRLIGSSNTWCVGVSSATVTRRCSGNTMPISFSMARRGFVSNSSRKAPS